MTERVLYRCVPVPDRRIPTVSGGLLLAAGFLLWLAAPKTGWGALVRFGGLAALTAGLYLTLRYLLRNYIYSLEQQEGGRVDFVVTEQVGRRRTDVCRVSVEEIVGLKTLALREKPPRPAPGVTVYHYCADFRPRGITLLYLNTDAGESVLRIKPDTAMLAWLARFVSSAD